MSKLPGYRSTFPKYPRRQLSTIVPVLCEHGISLAKALLTYHPNQRVTTKDAVLHKLFDDVPDRDAYD